MILQVAGYNEPKEDVPLNDVMDQFFEMCKNQISPVVEVEQ